MTLDTTLILHLHVQTCLFYSLFCKKCSSNVHNFSMSKYIKCLHNQVMPRKKKTAEDDLEGFSTTGADGRMVRGLLLSEPLRYLNEVGDIKRPAAVVDKMRKAHLGLMRFNRESLKFGIRKILLEDEVKTQLEEFFSNHARNDLLEGDDDDSLVSTAKWCSAHHQTAG